MCDGNSRKQLEGMKQNHKKISGGKKMKRVTSMILAAAMCCTALIGCGSSTSTTGSATTTAAAAAEAGATTAAADAAASGARVLKISIAHSEGSPCVESLKQFGEELYEKSNGELTVEVYPNTQLSGGNQTTAIQMVQSGEIEIALTSNVVECGVIPSLNIVSVPFIWTDEAEIDKTLARGTDVYNIFYDDMAQKDLILLGFAESGFREITNNVRAIKEPADMDNIKIRVLGNKMLNAAYTALGANPTDYNFNELYTALQQGTLDGQENPISTCIIPQRYEEVQKYLTIARMAYDAQVIQIGKVTWDSLTESQQAALQECIDNYVVYSREAGRARYAEDVQHLKDAGMDVYELTADQIAEFKAITDPAVKEYIAQYNQDLYDAIIAAKQN